MVLQSSNTGFLDFRCQTVTHNNHVSGLQAVGEVTTVAPGEIACKYITAGRRMTTCDEDFRTRGHVILFLEATVPEVDLEEGVIGVVATWELNALGVRKRRTTIAGNVEVRAHGVKLTAYQIWEM